MKFAGGLDMGEDRIQCGAKWEIPTSASVPLGRTFRPLNPRISGNENVGLSDVYTNGGNLTAGQVSTSGCLR